MKINKKVLFVATITGHINAFHIPYLKLFKDNGWETHVVTGDNGKVKECCDKKCFVPIARSPYKLSNLKAIKELKKIIDKEKYDIIHCHTPMGAVVTRLAARDARKKYGTRVIYTAHGFHFYKGAPLLNWLLFYPIEWYLAKFTDTIITINKEDYNTAKKKFSKRCKDIQYVPGVGINTEKFDIKMTEEEKIDYRKSLGLTKDDFVLTFVARLNKNKNQILLIQMIKALKQDIQNIKLLLVGNGPMMNKYKKIIRDYNLEENIKLLGKREDINEILSITDIYVASSLREGLPVNIMEAMYKKLPIIATDNRGHRELIINENNGYIVKDEKEMKEKITTVLNNSGKRIFFGNESSKRIQVYLLDEIIRCMKQIYIGDE